MLNDEYSMVRAPNDDYLSHPTPHFPGLPIKLEYGTQLTAIVVEIREDLSVIGRSSIVKWTGMSADSFLGNTQTEI